MVARQGRPPPAGVGAAGPGLSLWPLLGPTCGPNPPPPVPRSRALADRTDVLLVQRDRGEGSLRRSLGRHLSRQTGRIYGLHKLVDAGIDAIIAADPAVLQIAKEVGLPIHLSVQANVTNLVGVQFYSMFADVIVLAREVTLPQIQGIIHGIREKPILGPSGKPIQIEIFAHGALCVAYSGKCQMSLSIYGPKASATRGACFQPCRRTYGVTDQETGTELVIDGHQVMSPKDLCTLPFLDQILDAGVSVLKIEGRGRSPDFVATVVRVYREAIDAWKQGTFQTQRESGVWMDELSKVFNRGFWEGGYYLGKKLGDWAVTTSSEATETKVFIGQITKYYPRIGVAETVINFGPLVVNDELWVIGEKTGAVRIRITELRIGDSNAPVPQAEKGEAISFPVSEKVRVGDKLYKTMTNDQ